MELPTQGTSGKNLSKMSQIGFSFSGSRIAEWIWKYIVGEPCSLYHLLNRDSSLSNCAISLKAKILFFILLSQNAGPTLTLSYKIYFTISQNGTQNDIFVAKITDFSYSNLEYSRTKKAASEQIGGRCYRNLGPMVRTPPGRSCESVRRQHPCPRVHEPGRSSCGAQASRFRYRTSRHRVPPARRSRSRLQSGRPCRNAS